MALVLVASELGIDDKKMFDQRYEKVKYKTEAEGLKIIWQWVKAGEINFKVFQVLIKHICY